MKFVFSFESIISIFLNAIKVFFLFFAGMFNKMRNYSWNKWSIISQTKLLVSLLTFLCLWRVTELYASRSHVGYSHRSALHWSDEHTFPVSWTSSFILSNRIISFRDIQKNIPENCEVNLSMCVKFCLP